MRNKNEMKIDFRNQTNDQLERQFDYPEQQEIPNLLNKNKFILILIPRLSSVGRAWDCSCYKIPMVAGSNPADEIFIYIRFKSK